VHVEGIGHGEDALALLHGGDDDAERSRDIQRQALRGLPLHRVDEAGRADARLGRIDRRDDLGVWRERDERRAAHAREDVRELVLVHEAEPQERGGD